MRKALKRSDRVNGGRPPFDDLLMFRLLVLQALYNLSDEQAEYQVRDRLSFMRFLGLDMDGTAPDARTIWLFREKLAQAGAVEKLFARFDRYLEKRGLMASGGQIIDASIIPVPRQRNDREENDAIKAGKTPAEWKKNRCASRGKPNRRPPPTRYRKPPNRRLPSSAAPFHGAAYTLTTSVSYHPEISLP